MPGHRARNRDGRDQRVLPCGESGHTPKWGEVSVPGPLDLPHRFKDALFQLPRTRQGFRKETSLRAFEAVVPGQGEEEGAYTRMLRSSVAQKGAG